MQKIILPILISALVFTACQNNNTTEQNNISTYAKQLFESRNAYIGDASADSRILELLKISEEMGRYSIQLKTEKQPYVIKISFEDPVNNREEFDLKAQDKAFLILALIDNVDEVQLLYPDVEEEKDSLITIRVTKDQAEEILGADIKSYSKTDKGIEKLLNQLSYQQN